MKVQIIFSFILGSLVLNAEHLLASTIPLDEFTMQANLALRQVGHELLKIAGNDTLMVSPVQQKAAHKYVLPISHTFNYDTLPFLIHDALAIFKMEQIPYNVTVTDCLSDTLILGYDFRQFKAGTVPCIGRFQYSECNNIYLTFTTQKPNLNTNHSWIYLLSSLALIGFAYSLYAKKDNVTPTLKTTSTILLSSSNSSELLDIGHCQLDVTNQLLYINTEKKELTFRETKLLQYFGEHPNELLNRETLLEKVWEDEGVIVGRSLDVFVSRLRKILKPETSVTIKTVHGIGYRMEVSK